MASQIVLLSDACASTGACTYNNYHIVNTTSSFMHITKKITLTYTTGNSQTIDIISVSCHVTHRWKQK